MDEKFFMNLQGRQFVKYEGLLNEVHQQGLESIEVTILQYPSEENGQSCVCQATVVTKVGTFTEVGDANPSNTNRMVAPHLIRLAATRAKARAIRDAVNIGVTAVEELGEPEPEELNYYEKIRQIVKKQKDPATFISGLRDQFNFSGDVHSQSVEKQKEIYEGIK